MPVRSHPLLGLGAVAALASCSVVRPRIDPALVCPPTLATITDVAITAPPPGRLLELPGTYYLVGDLLDLSMTIPDCTGVTGVALDYGRRGNAWTLGTTASPDGIDSVGAYYEVRDDAPLGNGMRRVSLRLHVPNGGDGTTILVVISVAARRAPESEEPGTPRTAEHGFYLAGVKSIGAPAKLSISELELHNGLIAEMYATFGDKGEMTRGPFRLHPIYERTSLKVTPGGITIDMGLGIATTCSAKAQVTGTFKIDETNALAPVWVSGPNTSLDTAWYCAPAEWQGSLTIWLNEGLVRDFVRSVVDPYITVDAADGNAAALGKVAYGDGELLIEFPSLASNMNIGIEVSYDASSLDDAWDRGLQLHGAAAIFIANGRPKVCREDGVEHVGSCTPSYSPGPAGLFNWEANAPVPSPYTLWNGVWSTNQQRLRAREALKGFSRAPDLLPKARMNVGRLLVRMAEDEKTMENVRDAGLPCGVALAEFYQRRFAFGTNEHLASTVQNGVGKWNVTVLFRTGAPACPQ